MCLNLHRFVYNKFLIDALHFTNGHRSVVNLFPGGYVAVLPTAAAAAVNYDLCVVMYTCTVRQRSAFIFFCVFHRNRNGPTTNCAALPPPPPQQPPSGHLLRRRRFMSARSSPSTKHFNKQPHTSPLGSALRPRARTDLFGPSCCSTPPTCVFFQSFLPSTPDFIAVYNTCPY